MNFQAKSFVLVLAVSILILCRFCPCKAQDSLQNSLQNNQTNPVAVNFSDSDESNSSVFAYSQSTAIGNIEFSLLYQTQKNAYSSFEPFSGFNNVHQSGFLPQITIFSNRTDNQSEFQPVLANQQTERFDRYKNTIPVIYRVTLKGYSIMELSDNYTNIWSLDRVKDKPLKNPEILFSITKYF